VVVSQPTAQRPFAGQGLPRKGFGQHAQQKARSPVGMAFFQFPGTAENVRSRGEIARAKAAVGSGRNLASMVAAQAEQMADGASRKLETLRQGGGTQALLGSSPQGFADGLTDGSRHD